MASGQRVVPLRRKLGALFMLVGLITGTLGVFGPRVGADPIGNGANIGDFEIDNTGTDTDGDGVNDSAANFVVNDPSKIDWAGIADLADRIYWDDPHVLPTDPNGPGDQGFIGGAKEFDRSTWGCAADSGKTPDKDDLHYVLAYPSLSIDNATVAFSYVRQKALGNTNVVIEFNENPINSCSAVNDRTVGDLVLHFDFPGGTDAADLEAYVWTGSAFQSFDVPQGVANAATNNATIAVPSSISSMVAARGLPTSLEARLMGEAAIDLFALQDALEAADLPVDDVLECPGIGQANIRTRSSGTGDSSQLHDMFPAIAIDLSNCASLKIKKVDDLGQPMEGITFGLFASEADALAGTPIAQLPSDPPQDLTCVTDADGICEWPKVPEGDYFVNEIDLPDGYTPDPDLPAAVSLDPFENEDWTDSESEWFVNSLRTGSVLINKIVVDGDGNELDLTDYTYLDGITFELQDGGVTVQKRGGGDATCTLDIDAANDPASCQIDDVPFGTYDVVEDESTLPAGLHAGPSVPVTVDEDSPEVAEVDYENPADPLTISIDKAGPDTANVGDTITYTFKVGLGDLPFDTTDDVDLQPLTAVDVDELIDLSDPGQLYDDRCDVTALHVTDKDGPGTLGDAWLEAGEIWTYECKHLVTLAEATDSDGTELWNNAQVEGTDRYGRTDDDADDHLVTILLPDVRVEKTPDNGVILPGQNAVYTIAVTNDGPGRANSVTLTDNLPDGIDWSENSSACSITPDVGIEDQVLSCSFGDMADDATASVTVTGATDTSDCGELPNSATVAATNELANKLGNNTDNAKITVSCADVTVLKTTDDADKTINAGDPASFTILVTNLSATASATGVTLTDELPDGIDWAVSGADAAACGIVPNVGTQDQVLTCDFGTIAASGTRTVTVSGATDPADCGRLTNTATVSSTNEAAGADDNNESTDILDIECPNVWVEKSGPAEVNATDTITWTIEFGNDGDGDAYDVLLTDNLPTGLTGYVLGGPDADVCDLGGSTITCSFEVMEAGASYEITVTGTTDPADCPSVTNPVGISATNEAEGADGDNSDSATTRVLCPNLDMEKVADEPSTVPAGDPVGFTIVIENSGDPETVGTAYDVELHDTLPSIPGYTWDIESDSPECTLVGLQLDCDFGDMPNASAVSVHLVASFTGEDPEQCDVWPNTATVSLTNGVETNADNNSDSVEILCPGVNLNKVADNPLVEAGDEIGFSITVTNLDDGVPPAEGEARGVVVVDDLPGDLEWTIADDSVIPEGEGLGCVIALGVLTCNLGDLPAVSEGPQVVIHVVAPTTNADCTTYDNTATATVDNGEDPDPSSDSARVRCPLDIDLDKTGDTLAHVGDVVDYEFTVTNTGGVDLINVNLTDPECDEGTIVAGDNGPDDVLEAGTWDEQAEAFVGGEVWTFSCQRTIEAGDVVEVDGVNVALNTGTVTAEDEDGRDTDDTDPHVVEIINPAIQVVKTVDDSTPGVGQTITFSYAVTNTGDTTLFEVVVVDDQLGAIGTIDELAPGETVVLTKDMVVAADSPTLNIATATGSDVLGKTVTDDDPETITIVLGTVIPRPLPRTGADSQVLLLLAGGFLLLGGLLVASGEGISLSAATRRREG